MELFKLLGTIAIDNSEANQGIDETTDKAERSQSKIADAFGKIGKAAVTVGKTVATGLAVGTAAVGAIAKQALDSYADYEQLVGGVETLFKESGEAVMEYANNAYKTAGLSANEYMETVTSFSASLLQGLDGDTAKAAEVANRAITDMSDNANKMGTDMSMLQNAYQGFAKQNYTMLDNLKLGYGGTQAEMARLINDSGVLGDTMVVTAETVNEVSFDKIIEAIGVVQDRMGITGTTAKEASETISGSLAATKSAWQNLLTGFADDSQDLGALIENVIDSATTAVHNIVPRIAQILSGISEAMAQIMPIVSAELPIILQQLLPGLIKGATSLITGLVKSLPVILEILIAELPNIMVQICSALIETLPILLQTVEDLLGQIWNGISRLMKGIVNGIILGIETMINGAIDGLNGLIRSINKLVSKAGSLLGLNISIPEIKKLSLPRLEKGGILEKGQIGLLEGNGAEAVVPLDQNQAWISAVAKDMNSAVGGDNERLQKIIDLLQMLIDTLPETMTDAFGTMKFDVNNREFARMVKAVN